MQVNKIITGCFLVMLISTFVSCKKFVAVDPPKNNLTTSVIFADSAGATSAVLGVYTRLIGSGSWYFGSGGITLYTGLSSDELYNTTTTAFETEFYTNAVSTQNTGNDGPLFQNAYIIIYQANACIEGLTSNTAISSSLRNQLLGEAKLMRGFVYFNLVNLYGGVPLATSTAYITNAVLPRASVGAIYNQITADLLDASNLLTANYPSAGKVRSNLYAAYALLSRVYLYQKQWSQAEAYATKVISSNVYSLEPNLNNVFLATSNEAIWQIQCVTPGVETIEEANILPSSATVLPKYVITNYLLNAFETNDQRKVNWLKANTVSGQAYNYPFKYKLGRDGNTTPLEDYTIVRLAELYLIRAEAKAQQGADITGAIADLNAVRTRAGLPNTTASTQAALLPAIYHERQVELFCEWGHRWYDLKRLALIDGVLGSEKPNWNTNAALFPIPFSQFQLNPFLVQNPGY